ncbi:MAG TPA: hypothetical protein DCS67_10850 [Clostridiales bacterium UBA8960]|nr:hypothetical protein [Clostridiales bacterium UBA8960]
MFEMFIKSIHIDDAKRIVVNVQESIAEHFLSEDSRKMLKEMTSKALGADFIKLEAAKTSFRVTVAEGTEEASKVKIEEEIKKTIDMAMSFMSQGEK